MKYFEDPALKVLYAGQSGSFPYPDEDGLRRDRQMSETRETVERLKLELQEVRAEKTTQETSPTAPKPSNDVSKTGQRIASKARGRAARAAANRGGQGQLTLDVEGLGITSADRTALASAVQTTRVILAEHG